MPLSKAIVQPFRRNELFIGAGWRGFFAPFNAPFWATQTNSAVGPTILDLQNSGPFNTYAPPPGWFDIGWINGFKITPASKVGQIKSGYRGATRAQVRGEVAEQFEFKFREFTRLAFRLSTGCEIFNLLKSNTPSSTVGPLSSAGFINVSFNAVPVGVSGYQPTGGTATQVGVSGLPTVFLPQTSGSLFLAGQMIVVDVDYNQTTTGFIGGNGIPIFVNNAPQDVDFIRKTSDFIATISAVVSNPIAGVLGNQDALVLTSVIMGGGASPTVNPGPTNPGTVGVSGGYGATAPPGGVTNTPKVQIISGWVEREGATFILDYSAAFVCDSIDGDQILIFYPHVSIAQFKDIATSNYISNLGTTDESGFELDATFEALAFDDPIDGETVVGYHAYYPAFNLGRNF